MDNKKIIIIGGGVSGLSAGIYGQMNGFDTNIFEMHKCTGGQCTAWERGGYHFDYCLEWLVGSRRGVYNKLWKETHVLTENVKVIDTEIYSVIIDETYGKFIVYTNTDRWQDYLISIAPEDEKGIKKMCRDIKKSVNIEQFEDPPSCRSLLDYISMFLKMPGAMFMLMRYAKMPLRDYLHSLKLKNEKLLYFLSKFFGNYNFPSIVLIMMLGWFDDKNAGYLIGGSLPIAERMTKRYKDSGGTLSLDSRVEKIIIENNKACGVKLADGSEHRSDIVISAADGHATLYEMLEGKYLSNKFENAYKNWKLFTPFVQVSFGINDEVKSESKMTSYWQKPFKIGNFNTNDGYMILNQSMHDRTLAPEGKTSLILRFSSPWEDWEKVPLNNYQKEKEFILKDSIDILERHFPGIRNKIEVTDVCTPLTGNAITGVWKGSFEGFVPETNVIADSLPDRLPGLNNFYMIGQWVSPGGGLPPSVQSGKWIIQTLCKENQREFKVVY